MASPERCLVKQVLVYITAEDRGVLGSSRSPGARGHNRGRLATILSLESRVPQNIFFFFFLVRGTTKQVFPLESVKKRKREKNKIRRHWRGALKAGSWLLSMQSRLFSGTASLLPLAPLPNWPHEQNLGMYPSEPFIETTGLGHKGPQRHVAPFFGPLSPPPPPLIKLLSPIFSLRCPPNVPPSSVKDKKTTPECFLCFLAYAPLGFFGSGGSGLC